MTTSTPEFVQRLHDADAGSVLVRGRSAPTRPSGDILTFDAGAVATFVGDSWNLPLYVSVPTADGRTRRRFGTVALHDALEYTEQALSERPPEGVWFRHHARLVDCRCPLLVGPLEARLTRAAEAVEATLVTWTEATTPANDALYDHVVES
ncbi:hypothetical protein [Haladaptatus sp. NG-WS-4]